MNKQIEMETVHGHIYGENTFSFVRIGQNGFLSALVKKN